MVKFLVTLLFSLMLSVGTTSYAQSGQVTSGSEKKVLKNTKQHGKAAKVGRDAKRKTTSKMGLVKSPVVRSTSKKGRFKQVALSQNGASSSSARFKRGSAELALGAISRPAARPAVVSAGELAGLQYTHDQLDLKSNAALVVDQLSSAVLFDKNADVALPIASITKLMTSLVVLEAGQDMAEMIEVTTEDIDKEKGSSSRLHVGSKLSRSDMLHIALI